MNCLWKDLDCSSMTRPPLHSTHLLFSSPLIFILLRSSGAATPTVNGLLGMGSPPYVTRTCMLPWNKREPRTRVGTNRLTWCFNLPSRISILPRDAGCIAPADLEGVSDISKFLASWQEWCRNQTKKATINKRDSFKSTLLRWAFKHFLSSTWKWC